ncbi:hypothetical protein DPMN_075503 [Dreissena polymorpha]|uniref:Uncharacterized protein n=1 Tax=Dreissena polymorpha TaxID=45954 RepID=A0A9D3YKL3_DREPO|nr:hypothetical protein DPMN_075503 [Dreissena polymorpha]
MDKQLHQLFNQVQALPVSRILHFIVRLRDPDADTERSVQAFKHKCLRRLLLISFLDHKTNKYVWNMTAARVGPQTP